jgi:hypothetical protein
MQSNNNSIASETSSKFNEESRIKIDTLMNAFEDLGWDNQKDLTQDEIRYFLNNRAKDGQFDPTLAQKLFSILDVNDENRITGEEFIKGYLQFEADLKKNNDEFNRKFMQEQNNFNNLEEQCRLYKSEKLSPEGFCENAKITVEITDVDIKKEIEGISGIIIKVIYNDEIEEKKLLINDNNDNNKLIVNEKFEFKPTSRRDRFEFIMIKVDENNNESEIGSKRFPLDEITSQEEYLVQITIPEIEDEEQVAAHINCKIVLFWSDYEFFEEKKKKSEQRLKKLNDALNKTNYYLQKIKEIYGELKPYDSQYNNTYNNINNSNNQINNQQIQDNRITDDKKFINLNNYTNYNDNDIASPSTKNEILRGQKGGLGALIDSTGDPQTVLRIESSTNNDIMIPFRGKKCVIFFGFCIILSGIIGSLKRPDFPNILEGILVVLSCIIGIKNGLTKAVKWFKYVLWGDLSLLLFDLIWICTHYDYIWIDKYNGGNENLIGLLSVICCGLSMIVKALLAVLLYKQYSDTKQLEANNKNNYY